MSFKIVLFAAAVFTCQANAQIVSGFIRPFITGYANGINEFTKPFIQMGQSSMAPAGEYFPPSRPQMSQWLVYPNPQRPVVPSPSQVQNAAYEGFENVASPFPAGANVVQFVRPRPYQPFIYPVPNQGGNLVRPPRPYFPVPTPVPASDNDSSSSSSSEESGESVVPSNVAPQPLPQVNAAVETAERIPATVESNVAPYLEKPLETAENAINN